MKTWIEKREHCKSYQIKILSKNIAGMSKGSKMLIADTKIFDEYIKKIPKGHFIKIKEIRHKLAKEYNCDITCPLTTGIFIRIVSEAAYQEFIAGLAEEIITPFWRVIDINSNLAKKLTCGINFIKSKQKKEGILPFHN